MTAVPHCLHVGSSPLTRGKRPGRDLRARQRGLIPAHAGKTLASSAGAPRERAHPRSCGENNVSRQDKPASQGSSPLMRGKRLARFQRCPAGGLIPAHAGKTYSTTPKQTAPKAHPRSCGENAAKRQLPLLDEGSSPLMRGKRQARRHQAHPHGLIPAHAGKTCAAD